MILCPLQDRLNFLRQQKPPRISQEFGMNPGIYKQYGMKGHNGIDFAVPVGTPIYMPFDGKVKVRNSGKAGYGLHVRIRSGNRECVIGHMSRVYILDGQTIKMGHKIGLSGNTGHSTGPHVHVGLRMTTQTGKKNPFNEMVLNYGNGYYGYYDPKDYLITWMGTVPKLKLE